MITTEVVALAITAWFLISFLFGLVAGRIIQICRCPHPGACEICRLPDEQEPQTAAHESAEANEPVELRIAG